MKERRINIGWPEVTMKERRVNIKDTYIACQHCPDDTHHDHQYETIEDDDNSGMYVLLPWLAFERSKVDMEKLEVEKNFAYHLEEKTHTLRELELQFKIDELTDKLKRCQLDEITGRDERDTEITQLELTINALTIWIGNLHQQIADLTRAKVLLDEVVNSDIDISDLVLVSVTRDTYEKLKGYEAGRKGCPCKDDNTCTEVLSLSLEDDEITDVINDIER